MENVIKRYNLHFVKVGALPAPTVARRKWMIVGIAQATDGE